MAMTPGTHAPRLFRTQFHPCGYWPDRFARDLLMDPNDPNLGAFYGEALNHGFRRSGEIVYRPDCVACKACVAARIPVAEFLPDRSQRRCVRANADLTVRIVPAERTPEIFALYRRYLQARHPAGGMDQHTEADFDAYLVERWAHGRFIEMRLREGPQAGRLLAVAVTDVLPEALSAVYTFYEPGQSARGLGTFGVLSQIDWARREHRAHLYLGYWIAAHPKMDYKRRFQPLELFDGHGWSRALPPGAQDLPGP